MPQLTAAGRITLPKFVREMLHLDVGDAIDFVVLTNGTIQVRTANCHVRHLRGLLKRPGRRAVAVEAMNCARGWQMR